MVLEIAIIGGENHGTWEIIAALILVNNHTIFNLGLTYIEILIFPFYK